MSKRRRFHRVSRMKNTHGVGKEYYSRGEKGGEAESLGLCGGNGFLCQTAKRKKHLN